MPSEKKKETDKNSVFFRVSAELKARCWVFLFGKGHTAVVPAQVELAAVTLWCEGCVYFPHPQGSTDIESGLRIRVTCTNTTPEEELYSELLRSNPLKRSDFALWAFYFLFFPGLLFKILIRLLSSHGSSRGI